jgi:hypothetical protein
MDEGNMPAVTPGSIVRSSEPMTANPVRKLPFVLAASDHGTMIVNRFDYQMIDQERGFGVGLDILNTAAFDRAGVEFAGGLLALRRQYFGDGVVATDDREPYTPP